MPKPSHNPVDVVNTPNTPQDITKSRKPKGIPLADILELQSRNPDMTQDEMATILGCDRTNISKRLAGQEQVTKSLDRYSKYEGRVIAKIRQNVATALQDFTPEDLKKYSPRDLSVTFGVLYDKGRLEAGKSTANVSLADAGLKMVDSLQALSKELEALSDIEVPEED